MVPPQEALSIEERFVIEGRGQKDRRRRVVSLRLRFLDCHLMLLRLLATPFLDDLRRKGIDHCRVTQGLCSAAMDRATIAVRPLEGLMLFRLHPHSHDVPAKGEGRVTSGTPSSS